MKYCIFSDESGSWADSREDYYIRSWVRYEQGAYFEIERNNQLLAKLFELNLNELKWNSYDRFLSNCPEVLDNLFLYPPKIFIEFTLMGEFRTRPFDVREHIKSSLRRIKKESAEEKKYLKNLPSKVINAVNGILFLNIYERFNIENALEGLVDNDEQYYCFIDSPQFIKHDYRTLFSKCVESMGLSKNILKKNISDSRDCLGIQTADLIAGCFNTLLESNLSNRSALDFYHSYVKPYLTKKGNIIDGINKVTKNTKKDNDLEIIKKIKLKLT